MKCIDFTSCYCHMPVKLSMSPIAYRSVVKYIPKLILKIFVFYVYEIYKIHFQLVKRKAKILNHVHPDLERNKKLHGKVEESNLVVYG